MPLYSYEALNSKGEKRKGVVEGANDLEAKRKLRNQGVMIVSLTKRTSSAYQKENINAEQLQSFTLQLSQLSSAGLPIYESLLALEEQYRGEKFHRIILSLCDQIKEGASLSEAMATFPESFNNLYCMMIAAGETSGALDVVLERLNELLKKQAKLKGEIMTAMIYPSVLACFSIGVIGLLFGFVVPSIEGMFAGKELNTFTSAIISLSHFVRGYWWLYLPIIAVIVGLLYTQLQTVAGKKWLEINVMKLPMIGNLMVQAALARFCRTMGTLLEGGLPMIEALKISKGVMQNITLESEVGDAIKKIIEGSSLSQELAGSRYIPKMVTRMLAVGEESGSTVKLMNKIADIYEENLEKTIERVLALMQPLILIVMGGIIGTVVMAILLPLTDMSSFAL